MNGGSVGSATFPRRPIVLVSWFALCTAGLELAFMAGHKLEQGVIYSSLDIIWMTPLAYLILFSPIIPAVAVLRKMRPTMPWFTPTIVVLVTMASFSLVSLFWVRLGPVASLLLTAGITVQLTRYILRHMEGFARVVRRTLPWMFGLALLAGAGLTTWGRLRESLALRALPAGRSMPNVILLVLDTVRAMNLSLYGYPRKTTPALERFASSAVVFEEAYSTAPWTLPSIATMFTGRYPHEHGADWTTPLPHRNPTLAEVFRDAGYNTAGFAANVNYSSEEVGLGRGFIHYEDYTATLFDILLSSSPGRFILNNPMLRRTIRFYDIFSRKSADRLNEAFLSWLGRHPERPFFAYLNYYDAHEAYLPPSPFDTLFGPDTVRDKSLIRLKSTRDAHRIKKEAMSEPERAAEEQAYDGAIAYLDSRLGRLFAELDRHGLAGNTIVVITADHGELFGEHALFTHGNSLYLPLLRVPLLLQAPNLPRGARIATPVTLRDLPRSVLDLAGLDDRRIPGTSFPGLASRNLGEAAGSPILAELGPAREGRRNGADVARRMWSIISKSHQYILGGDGKEELYNLRGDPAEAANLASDPSLRPLLEHLRANLDSARRK